jgi:hypothetical protein
MAAEALSPRTGRRVSRQTFAQDIQDAHASFEPGELSSLASRPYENAYGKVLMFKIADSDTQRLNAIEDEFKLPRHRLSKFVAWKKKQPEKLIDIRMSDAERVEAARTKKKRELLDQHAQWEAEREKAKWVAAAEIQQQYRNNLSEMILEAAREAIKGMRSSPENPGELDVSAKAVCL